MKRGDKHSPEARAAMLTRMRDPAMRAKIAERTRVGMAQSEIVYPELAALRRSWRAAPPATRQRFLQEILAIACGGNPQ